MESSGLDELVHLYRDGAFARRELFRRAAAVLGGPSAAAAALAAFGVPEKADAEDQVDECPATVPEDADDLDSRIVEFSGESGKLFGYFSMKRGEAGEQAPAVLVIHENRGLNQHIQDVTRRVARADYVGLGIDLLSRQGGSAQFTDPQQAANAYRNVTSAMALEDMKSAVAYLRTLEQVRADRIGCVGFCAGGGNAWNLAVEQPDLSAAVVFYGAPAAATALEELQVPMLLIYAETDRGLTGRVGPVLTALSNARKPYGLHVYEGVGHAFHNDTGPAYNAAAACDAWGKTLAFFRKHLDRPDEE